MGSPIKGRVKKKNTSPQKKHAVFYLRLIGCRFGLKLLIILFRARYFRLWFAWSLTRVSHPSGSRQLCFLPQNTAPSALADQKIVGTPPKADRRHADSNCIITDHVVINQPLCGYRHRRIKIKNRLWVQQVPIRPGGLLPNPRMVLCCTQTDYRNNFSSSNAT